ncbi:MAG: hypothetical protein H7838_09315 [Magnetococcus sp. DMHC-8]
MLEWFAPVNSGLSVQWKFWSSFCSAGRQGPPASLRRMLKAPKQKAALAFLEGNVVLFGRASRSASQPAAHAEGAKAKSGFGFFERQRCFIRQGIEVCQLACGAC